MHVAIAAMRLPTALILFALLTGCASNGQRIDRLAAAAGMNRIAAESGGYGSYIYMKRAAAQSAPGQLTVFLEGDGRPWENGRQPSIDPTTGNPVSLQLLLRTPSMAAYVTRPCYHDLRGPRCTPERWTMARYAEDIVSSITTAVRIARREAGAKQVVLVGYSGGGTLAVLVAERLENVAGVVTISANLDVDAWVRHHGYLPLTGSLNPALSERSHPWPELHLHGAKDAVVPVATTAHYFERYPAAKQIVMEQHDHVCCWVDEWPTLWAQLGHSLLNAARAASPTSGKSVNAPSMPSL
jgi:pimeloyl-ACP methyl ester carboxylesterase